MDARVGLPLISQGDLATHQDRELELAAHPAAPEVTQNKEHNQDDDDDDDDRLGIHGTYHLMLEPREGKVPPRSPSRGRRQAGETPIRTSPSMEDRLWETVAQRSRVIRNSQAPGAPPALRTGFDFAD